MKLRIFINNTEVPVMMKPSLKFTMDETLDTGSLLFAASSLQEPFAPMQTVRIEFLNSDDTISETRYFYTLSDAVRVFSLKPPVYQHEVMLVQQTRKFAKHLCRNTVFTQPAVPRYTLRSAQQRRISTAGNVNASPKLFYATLDYPVERDSAVESGWEVPVTLMSHVKIKQSAIVCHCHKVKFPVDDDPNHPHGIRFFQDGAYHYSVGTVTFDETSVIPNCVFETCALPFPGKIQIYELTGSRYVWRDTIVFGYREFYDGKVFTPHVTLQPGHTYQLRLRYDVPFNYATWGGATGTENYGYIYGKLYKATETTYSPQDEAGQLDITTARFYYPRAGSYDVDDADRLYTGFTIPVKPRLWAGWDDPDWECYRLILSYDAGGNPPPSLKIWAYDAEDDTFKAIRLVNGFKQTINGRDYTAYTLLREYFLPFTRYADFRLGIPNDTQPKSARGWQWKHNADAPEAEWAPDEKPPFWLNNYYTSAEMVIEQYYFTMYDVLSEINDTYVQHYKSNESQDDAWYYKRPSLYTLPSSGKFYDLLTKTLAPNFTFTQMSYFEVLSQIFQVFDGVMTIDAAGRLGIEYYNEQGQQINELPLTGVQKTISEQYFNNAIGCYYTGARTRLTYPQVNYLRNAPQQYGVPQHDISSWAMTVPQPIENINALWVHLGRLSLYLTFIPAYPGEGVYYLCQFSSSLNDASFFAIDIKRNVVTSEEWALLPDGQPFERMGNTMIYKSNVLSYDPGSKKIETGQTVKAMFWDNTLAEPPHEHFVFLSAVEMAFFQKFGILYAVTSLALGSSPGYDHHHTGVLGEGIRYRRTIGINKPHELEYRFDYTVKVDGYLQMESLQNKYPGSMLGDQAAADNDFRALGRNMLGTVTKLGEDAFTASLPLFKSWDERIEKGAYWEDEHGKPWLANVVSFEFIDKAVIEKVQFVKFFNKLSQRTRIAQTKRFTEISQSVVSMCQDVFTEYIYYSSAPLYPDSSYSTNGVVFSNASLAAYLTATFKYDQGITTDIRSRLWDYIVMKNKGEHINVPFFKISAGNCWCIDFGFDSPVLAGNAYSAERPGDDKPWYYFARPVIYTDDEGFQLDWRVKFMQNRDNDTFDTEFPLISNTKISHDHITNELCLRFHKKPNEIMRLNFEMCFLPACYNTTATVLNQTYAGAEALGKGFFDRNGFLGNMPPRLADAHWRLYYSSSGTVNIFDTLGGHLASGGAMTRKDIREEDIVVSYVAGSGGVIVRTNFRAPYEVACWMLCDEEDHIYFISNRNVSAQAQFAFYFICSRSRL